MTRPLRFVFGLHLHQPIGNFDSVFEDHVANVYLPLLQRLSDRDLFPIALHISGPLLEWMQAHDSRYLDLLGRLVAERKVELLLAGMYEPVLVSLPRQDRIQQIGWMRDLLASRFGVDARGLWLTERVWEPGLASDLADAGVEFALIDDHHFESVGFPRNRLHTPYWTEDSGKRVALFPIDEKLRYLIPFHPVEETAAYLRELRAAGHQLAVLADDAEKFGGWPGTRELVYAGGWLDRFIDSIQTLVENGEVTLSTFADALREVPSGGLAYLPAVSYREMGMWSLPAEAAARLERLEEELGPARMAGPDGALLQGGHWRNFQVKYAESNRMHKKMLALSAVCRARGDPADARRAIGRGQCNDAYWHGVFGGLYLPHLRQGVWRELARAEALLREGESLKHEVLDLDHDGADEIWVHSRYFSAVVSPARGGTIEELTMFAAEINYADTLTRRREAYHRLREAASDAGATGDATSHAPSIHETEQRLRLDVLPPVDLDVRVLFVDRVLSASVTAAEYERAEYIPAVAADAMPLRGASMRVHKSDAEIVITLTTNADRINGMSRMTKIITFNELGDVRVEYEWDGNVFPPGSYFAPEISLAAPAMVRAIGAEDTWRFGITTVSKSEHGFETTFQGESVTPMWSVAAGHASVTIGFGSGGTECERES